MFEYGLRLLSYGNICIRNIRAGNAVIIPFLLTYCTNFYTFNVLLLNTLKYTKYFHP